MSLEKVKRKLYKILEIVMNYEVKKWKVKKEIKKSTKSINKLTDDIRNTPVT